MKNNKELNPRQRRFTILRASGMGQFEAYKAAGYKGKECDASVLAANSKIIKEIQSLQTKTEEQAFDLVKECQKLSPAAIRVLETVIESSQSDGYRLNAVQQLLDRGFGKPKERIDVSGGVNINVTIEK